jgi:hypothetical protein
MSKNKKYLDKRLKAAQFDDVQIRDSGISMDDSSSETSSTPNRQSINFIPSRHVLNRVKCFEMLASEQAEYHSNPNWWLVDRRQQKSDEVETNVDEEEKPTFDQQTSVNSKTSRHSSIDSDTSTTVPDVPEITYDDDEEIEENKEEISDEEEEEVEEPFIRQSMSRIRIIRPESITSQTSM